MREAYPSLAEDTGCRDQKKDDGQGERLMYGDEGQTAKAGFVT